MVDPIIPASRHAWEWRRHPAFRDVDLTRGERAADRMRNGMGSWLFVGVFIALMLIWAAVNATTAGWDPYPYILLNLLLSTIAGLQGAVLLIAARRQDQIAGQLAQHDLETTLKISAKVDAILAHLAVEIPADTLTVPELRRSDVAALEEVDPVGRGPAAGAAVEGSSSGASAGAVDDPQSGSPPAPADRRLTRP